MKYAVPLLKVYKVRRCGMIANKSVIHQKPSNERSTPLIWDSDGKHNNKANYKTLMSSDSTLEIDREYKQAVSISEEYLHFLKAS